MELSKRDMTSKEANFDVRIVGLKTENQTNLIRKGVVRDITDKDGKTREEVIGIVTPKYNLVLNKDAQNVFDESIRSSFVAKDVDKMIIKTHIPKNGARLYKSYTFTSGTLGVELGRADKVYPTITLLNSYDQSKPFGFTIGSYRVACENGLVVGVKDYMYSVKHFKDTTPDSITPKFNEALEKYFSATEIWKKWSDVKYTEKQANEYLELFPVVSKKIKELVVEQFKKEEQTKWMFFNAITNVISHQLRVRNMANIIIAQERLMAMAKGVYNIAA